MNTRVKTRLAAGLTAGAMMLALPGAALAQPTQADVNADAQADVAAQADVNAQVNTGSLISALNNLSVEIDELNALNDLTVGDVTVVDVDNVLNANNVEAFNNALNNNDVDIDADVLNDSVIEVLNANDVDVDDVVAVNVLDNGDVVVFVD